MHYLSYCPQNVILKKFFSETFVSHKFLRFSFLLFGFMSTSLLRHCSKTSGNPSPPKLAWGSVWMHVLVSAWASSSGGLVELLHQGCSRCSSRTVLSRESHSWKKILQNFPCGVQAHLPRLYGGILGIHTQWVASSSVPPTHLGCVPVLRTPMTQSLWGMGPGL